MFEFLTVCRALSDENRLRILMALRERELCVCQVTAFLDLAPSTTSKHLSILRQARLIESSKHGRWVYYRLAGERAPKAARDAAAWMTAALADDPVILSDEKRIVRIVQAERECGLGDVCCETFHSPELHSLDEMVSRESGVEPMFSQDEPKDAFGAGTGFFQAEQDGGAQSADSALSVEKGEKKNGGMES